MLMSAQGLTKTDQDVRETRTHIHSPPLPHSSMVKIKEDKTQEVKRKKRCMFCCHGDHGLVQWMQAVPLTASHGDGVLHTHTHTGKNDAEVC